jgi:Carbonic anhydrase
MGQGHDETTPYVPYDFASANNRYTTSPLFTPDPIVGARSRTGIITCCDARCSPEEFFMLPPNEAFVIRNGGGRTAEESVVRTLALIQVLSEVKEIKVVHHTGKYTHTHTERERERKLSISCRQLKYNPQQVIANGFGGFLEDRLRRPCLYRRLGPQHDRSQQTFCPRWALEARRPRLG